MYDESRRFNGELAEAGVAAEPGDSSCSTTSSGGCVIRAYSFCFSSSIKGSAAEGKSSSIWESVSTRATQIGVKEPPSKSNKPRAKAAADICTRPSSEL